MENLFVIFQDTFNFIIALSILIIVHEWGHYITAVKQGVRVERFSVGFGPKLFSRKKGDTEFMVCAIPLGGYVKMAGDERTECTGNPEEFYSKAPGRRALIIINGPMVNFVLAYLCFVLVFVIGYPGLSSTIGYIKENSPAQAAGLLVGDKIRAIDGKKIYGWQSFDNLMEGDSREALTVQVERDGELLMREVVPEIVDEANALGRMRETRDIGVESLAFSNVVGDIFPDSPAEEAGLQKGDRILRIDNLSISTWEGLQSAIRKSAGDTIRIVVERNGQEMVFQVKPEVEEVRNRHGEMEDVRLVGIAPSMEFDTYRFGFLESFGMGYRELYFITVMTYEAIFRMVTGLTPAKESVGGPVLIFNVFKAAADEGLAHWLLILGIVSASLAIFNLLPVIPLDGGHLFLLGIEKIRGKALSPKTDETIAKIGFSLIILLAIFIFYADFERIGLIDKIKGIIPN